MTRITHHRDRDHFGYDWDTNIVLTDDIGTTVSGGAAQVATASGSTLQVALQDLWLSDAFQWPFYIDGVQTTISGGTAYFETPEEATIDEVRVHLGTTCSGSDFIVDVNDDGVTVFTTQVNRPTITPGGFSVTSGAADGGLAVAKNSVLTVDVDQVGSDIAGSDLAIFVRGRFIR